MNTPGDTSPKTPNSGNFSIQRFACTSLSIYATISARNQEMRKDEYRRQEMAMQLRFMDDKGQTFDKFTISPERK